MQIAVSLDYDEITITHPILADINVGTLLLRHTLNCGTSSANTDLTARIGDIVGETLTINVNELDATKTLFDDGVYYFALDVGGPIVEGEPGTWFLTGCIYIGTTSRCKAVCLYEQTGNELVKYIIRALDISNDCDDCDCTTQCDLYEYLTSLLTNNSNSSTNAYSSCGCD